MARDHLDYYLDEFTFRFNRRTSRHRGKLFYRLVEQAVAVGPTPYARLVSDSNHNPGGKSSQVDTPYAAIRLSIVRILFPAPTARRRLAMRPFWAEATPT